VSTELAAAVAAIGLALARELLALLDARRRRRGELRTRSSDERPDFSDV
jgi:hypothetical protein